MLKTASEIHMRISPSEVTVTPWKLTAFYHTAGGSTVDRKVIGLGAKRNECLKLHLGSSLWSTLYQFYKEMESSLTAMDKYYLSGCLRELNSIWQSGTMKWWFYQYSVLL